MDAELDESSNFIHSAHYIVVTSRVSLYATKHAACDCLLLAHLLTACSLFSTTLNQKGIPVVFPFVVEVNSFGSVFG